MPSRIRSLGNAFRRQYSPASRMLPCRAIDQRRTSDLRKVVFAGALGAKQAAGSSVRRRDVEIDAPQHMHRGRNRRRRLGINQRCCSGGMLRPPKKPSMTCGTFTAVPDELCLQISPCRSS